MPKFFRRGISEVHALPAVADLTAPTALEIAAGVDLSEAIADFNGFQFANSPIDVPTLKKRATGKIPGEDTVADSSLVLYDDDTSDDIRTAVAKDTTMVLLFAPYGMGAGKRCETWPAVSTGVNDQWTMGNESARTVVGFACDVPEQNAVLP